MDAGGLYGLLKCSSLLILSTLVHTGPFKNFSLVICGQDDRTWLVMR